MQALHILAHVLHQRGAEGVHRVADGRAEKQRIEGREDAEHFVRRLGLAETLLQDARDVVLDLLQFLLVELHRGGPGGVATGSRVQHIGTSPQYHLKALVQLHNEIPIGAHQHHAENVQQLLVLLSELQNQVQALLQGVKIHTLRNRDGLLISALAHLRESFSGQCVVLPPLGIQFIAIAADGPQLLHAALHDIVFPENGDHAGQHHVA